MANRLAHLKQQITRPVVRYDEQVASKMMQLSYTSYQVLSQKMFYKSFQMIKEFRPKGFLGVKDLYGFVGVDKDIQKIIVCFRGTLPLSWINWIRDAKILQKQFQPKSTKKSFKMHQGFYDCYKLFKQDNIFQTISQLIKKYPTYQIIYTGHSLGGAIANATATLHKDQFKENNIQLYTFGQPRVGDKDYADFVDYLIPNNFRVINKLDIVPHIPFSTQFLKYQHSGYEIYYEKGTLQDFKIFKGDSKDGSNKLQGSIIELFQRIESSKDRPLQLINPLFHAENIFKLGDRLRNFNHYNVRDHIHLHYNRLKEKVHFKAPQS